MLEFTIAQYRNEHAISCVKRLLSFTDMTQTTLVQRNVLLLIILA